MHEFVSNTLEHALHLKLTPKQKLCRPVNYNSFCYIKKHLFVNSFGAFNIL